MGKLGGNGGKWEKLVENWGDMREIREIRGGGLLWGSRKWGGTWGGGGGIVVGVEKMGGNLGGGVALLWGSRKWGGTWGGGGIVVGVEKMGGNLGGGGVALLWGSRKWGGTWGKLRMRVVQSVAGVRAWRG